MLGCHTVGQRTFDNRQSVGAGGELREGQTGSHSRWSGHRWNQRTVDVGHREWQFVSDEEVEVTARFYRCGVLQAAVRGRIGKERQCARVQRQYCVAATAAGGSGVCACDITLDGGGWVKVRLAICQQIRCPGVTNICKQRRRVTRDSFADCDLDGGAR